MLQKKFFTHLLKAQYAAQSLNEQLNGKNGSVQLKIVPQKVNKESKRWFLTLGF